MARRLLSFLLGFALVLIGPATAMALNINESYRPQDEFKLDPWFSIGPIEFTNGIGFPVASCVSGSGTAGDGPVPKFSVRA